MVYFKMLTQQHRGGFITMPVEAIFYIRDSALLASTAVRFYNEHKDAFRTMQSQMNGGLMLPSEEQRQEEEAQFSTMSESEWAEMMYYEGLEG
jgi:hypothetical protein